MRTLVMTGRTATWVALLVLGLGAAIQAGTVDVYSNNPGPFGDAVTSVGPTGTANWSYDYVGPGATVGINSNIPDAHGGNGSLWMNGVDNGLQQYEGDTTYAPPTPLGLLSNLNTLSYEWFRSSTSTVAAWLAPAFALHVTNGATSGYLIYEAAYNGYPSSVPTNTWTTSNITANSQLWSTGGLSAVAPLPPSYTHSLSAWQGALSGFSIDSFTPFYGSGWTGDFTGAVDYIQIGFNGQDATTYDFEVRPVPEPASVVSMMIAGGLGLAGAAYRRRRAR